MDRRSLADVIGVRKCVSFFLKGLRCLHGVRHLVYRDINVANVLINLKEEPKITESGSSAGLENSMAMCATLIGTVTYVSSVQNESYSYPADIWSPGLALFECGTRQFPYTADEGLVNLMQQKDADSRPPAEQVSRFSRFLSARNTKARELILLRNRVTECHMFGGTRPWSFVLASGGKTSDFQRQLIIFFPSQNPDKGTHQCSTTWVSNADKGDVQRDERERERSANRENRRRERTQVGHPRRRAGAVETGGENGWRV
ncbi:hypothetical protein Vadar_016580 [Vaccinium darrowii]|uniref:Uncharacterized protein n=1 Tax=Vaccinium darrowii TaxID=229202 RepID=A0ACB7YE41_9ERIC|nr:hypothetical protein Vadar_016580 [Vaccinium darrowii]